MKNKDKGLAKIRDLLADEILFATPDEPCFSNEFQGFLSGFDRECQEFLNDTKISRHGIDYMKARIIAETNAEIRRADIEEAHRLHVLHELFERRAELSHLISSELEQLRHAQAENAAALDALKKEMEA